MLGSRFISTCVIKFDLDSGEQFIEPELNLARQMHSSCELGDAIYVFGGRNNGSLNSIERLQAFNNTSNQVPAVLAVGGSGVDNGPPSLLRERIGEVLPLTKTYKAGSAIMTITTTINKTITMRLPVLTSTIRSQTSSTIMSAPISSKNLS